MEILSMQTTMTETFRMTQEVIEALPTMNQHVMFEEVMKHLRKLPHIQPLLSTHFIVMETIESEVLEYSRELKLKVEYRLEPNVDKYNQIEWLWRYPEPKEIKCLK